MGHIQRRGDKWQARYRAPDGRERTRRFDRKIDAETWLATQAADVARGEWIDPRSGNVTFRDYAEGWRQSQIHRPATASQVESYLRRYVYPHLGGRLISTVRPSEIQALVKGWSDVLAPATVEVIFTWVSTIFAAAVADRMIAVSPCRERRIRRPEVGYPLVQLPAETVFALADAIAPRYRAAIVLGAGSGVRISEALGLTNDRVDWLRRTVTIDRQLLRTSGDDPAFGPVKDRKNRLRTMIPLPATVVDELTAHVALHELGPQGLIFTTAGGSEVGHSTWSDVWRRAAGPLGIDGGDGYHQLRHFYASVLIRAGESVKVVQTRLGHTSAQMTFDVYGHLWPDDEDHTRQALQPVLAPLSQTHKKPHTDNLRTTRGTAGL